MKTIRPFPAVFLAFFAVLPALFSDRPAAAVLPRLTAKEVSDGLPFFLEKEREPIGAVLERAAGEKPADPPAVGFSPAAKAGRTAESGFISRDGSCASVKSSSLPKSGTA